MRFVFDPARRRPLRILLVRLSAIGDVVHGLHGLAALRAVRPDAFVGWLVEDKARTLLEGHPDVDRVHVYPRRRWQRAFRHDPAGVAREAAEFLAGLRGARYDVAVDLQGNLKSGVLSALAGVPHRIGLDRGCDKEGGHRFATERIRVPPDGFHRVDRVYRLLAPLGVAGAGGVRRVPIADEDRAEVDAFLNAGALAAGAFAVLHPGASKRGASKRWPTDRYGRFARLLRDRTGLPSVVTWGPGEEGLAAAVVAASDGAARLAPPLPRLAALAELSRRAGLFVAGDTGALHLAAFLGTPTIGLYGPKDPRVDAARGPRTAVVYKGAGEPVPMETIQPEDVMKAAEGLLAPVAERGRECPGRKAGRSAARPAAGRCS